MTARATRPLPLLHFPDIDFSQKQQGGDRLATSCNLKEKWSENNSKLKGASKEPLVFSVLCMKQSTGQVYKTLNLSPSVETYSVAPRYSQPMWFTLRRLYRCPGDFFLNSCSSFYPFACSPLDGSQPMLIWSDVFSPEPHACLPSGGPLLWRTFCLLSCVTSGCLREEAGPSASSLPDDAVMLYTGLKSSRMQTSGSVISCILILSRGKAMICLSAPKERGRCPLGPPIQHWSGESRRPWHWNQITHLRSCVLLRPCWPLLEGGPGENNSFDISH